MKAGLGCASSRCLFSAVTVKPVFLMMISRSIGMAEWNESEAGAWTVTVTAPPCRMVPTLPDLELATSPEPLPYKADISLLVKARS